MPFTNFLGIAEFCQRKHDKAKWIDICLFLQISEYFEILEFLEILQ